MKSALKCVLLVAVLTPVVLLSACDWREPKLGDSIGKPLGLYFCHWQKDFSVIDGVRVEDDGLFRITTHQGFAEFLYLGAYVDYSPEGCIDVLLETYCSEYFEEKYIVIAAFSGGNLSDARINKVLDNGTINVTLVVWRKSRTGVFNMLRDNLRHSILGSFYGQSTQIIELDKTFDPPSFSVSTRMVYSNQLPITPY
jgi:hypothetical protein